MVTLKEPVLFLRSENMVTLLLPAICLTALKYKIPLNAFPGGTTDKFTGLFVLSNVSLLLNVMQGSWESLVRYGLKPNPDSKMLHALVHLIKKEN